MIKADVTTYEPEGMFHALLCDPPYHLTNPAYRNSNWIPSKDTPQGRAGMGARGGFMGKKWDGGDVAFRPETWAHFKKFLYPGAFGMAFASSRGFHRMAVAIEDAGFIIHPLIGHLFGSGFPKATRIKIDGVEVEEFSGHRYGLQAQKPALEPICLFQKPYEGKPVDCIVKTGAGALNIDGGRIYRDKKDTSGWSKSGSKESENLAMSGKNYAREPKADNESGRWPANFVLSEDMRYVIDEQSGNCKSGKLLSHHKRAGKSQIGTFNIRDRTGEPCNFGGDSGGASRYFFRYPVVYQAKANKKERNAGLEGFEEKDKYSKNGQANSHEVFAHGGDDAWQKKNPCYPTQNTHPTVKPIQLIKHLATLLLPPSGYHRRIYVPFAGVASEMIGCMLAGWDEVIGCEMEQEYIDIGEARIKYWYDDMKRQPKLL